MQAENAAHRVDVNEKGEVFFAVNSNIGISGSGWLSLDGLAFYSRK